ncbi:Uncharacterised protein g5700 [Pycnogonum litorale]
MASLGNAWQGIRKLESVLLINLSSNFALLNDQMVKASVENKSIFVLANQIMFFTLCDWWFKEQRVTSLYCLLFYNVMSYLVTYGKDFFTSRGYSPYVMISENTSVRHLAMTATKIVLDLTRAVTFIMTGVFMFVVFGIHQGLDNFSPSWTYICVTAIYYLLTEPPCRIYVHSLFAFLQLDALESMENLWIPVIIYFVTTSVSTCLWISIIYRFPGLNKWSLLLLAAYTNVYIGFEATRYFWRRLVTEKSCLDRYRYATRRELSTCDDVCAVCLQAMRVARVTPCRHLFHSDCLRLCIRQNNTCPMCKQLLYESNAPHDHRDR